MHLGSPLTEGPLCGTQGRGAAAHLEDAPTHGANSRASGASKICLALSKCDLLIGLEAEAESVDIYATRMLPMSVQGLLSGGKFLLRSRGEFLFVAANGLRVH